MTHARGTRPRHTISALGNVTLLGALAVGLAACSSSRPGVPVAPVASCVIGAAQPAAADTIVLATTTPIDQLRVPEATNTGERLVFAQVYQTLIDVDCDGRAQPALAASWTLDATKTRV